MDVGIALLPTLAATIMIPDVVSELSAEQLITALNKKLSEEFTGVRLMTPTFRAHAAMLAAKVWFGEPKGIAEY